MARSAIEWTQSSWNPVSGCTKVSPGCDHCYAERMAVRLQAMGQPSYVRVLELPLRWSKPQMVFVDSMGDVFHEDVPDEFIRRMFDVMRQASWHSFQLLTKRAERLERLGRTLDWPANVWGGVSVETRRYLFRLDHLRRVPARVRFVSFEPLLEPLGIVDLSDIQWAIVGGESGPGARPMARDWVMQIRQQCLASGIPFFFKQWGGVNKARSGRLLDGRTWNQMPCVDHAGPMT